MVLGKDKISALNAFLPKSVNPFRAAVPVQKVSSNQNTYGIVASSDPYNTGELSPVSDNGQKFDSNRWISNFGKL